MRAASIQHILYNNEVINDKPTKGKTTKTTIRASASSPPSFSTAHPPQHLAVAVGTTLVAILKTTSVTTNNTIFFVNRTCVCICVTLTHFSKTLNSTLLPRISTPSLARRLRLRLPRLYICRLRLPRRRNQRRFLRTTCETR
jgi:hypothetical protein